MPKNFYWKTTLKSIFTKIFSDGFCQKPFYRFWPPIIGEPVDREKNKNFSVSEIYLASWYKKPFVDISYGLRVIRPTRVGCPKKKATLLGHHDRQISKNGKLANKMFETIVFLLKNICYTNFSYYFVFIFSYYFVQYFCHSNCIISL